MEKKIATVYDCDDQLDCDNLPEFYCKWKRIGTSWTLESANTPSGAYCNFPAREKLYDSQCRYPCQSSRYQELSEDIAWCRATYRFQRGMFVPVDADSTGGGSCPGRLEEYSEQNPSFSFLVAFEFNLHPYCRGAYRFHCGRFRLIESSSSGESQAPIDLSEYSRETGFTFLVSLEFIQALQATRPSPSQCTDDDNDQDVEGRQPQADPRDEQQLRE